MGCDTVYIEYPSLQQLIMASLILFLRNFGFSVCETVRPSSCGAEKRCNVQVTELA